jgi:hypothetical protein
MSTDPIPRREEDVSELNNGCSFMHCAMACLAEASSVLFFSQPTLADERRREASLDDYFDHCSGEA